MGQNQLSIKAHREYAPSSFTLIPVLPHGTMKDLDNILEGTVEKTRASLGSLLPILEFQLNLQSQNRSVDVINADAEVQFTFPETDKTTRLNDVKLPASTLGQVSGSGVRADVICTLGTPELERIEDMRVGGDIEADITAIFHGKQSNQDDLGKGEVRLEYTIRASEWSEILQKFGYHDSRQFTMELGADDVVVRDVLSSVRSKVQRAEQRHNDGDYASSIRACRDAVESLQHIEEEVKKLVDDQKWEKFESNMGEFEKGFLGLLSHSDDRTNVEPPLQRDSDFVLGLTKSYVRYITQTVAEDRSGL